MTRSLVDGTMVIWRFFWKYGLPLLLVGVIAYQLATTWVPMWINAGERVGQDVSNLTIYDEAGQRVPLSSFRGAPLILDFWATWCLPCRAEFPLLAAAYPALREQGKQLLGVNLRENWPAINRYREEVEIPFPVYRDDGSLAEALGIRIIPSLVVIDAEGRVQAITYGFRPWVKWYLEWWI